MKKHLTFAVAALFAMTLFSPIFSGTLRAQEQGSADVQASAGAEDNQNSSEAQPSVGRVSVIRGNVSIQRGDSGDWVAATVNTPLESGDRISTGDDSRAAHGTILRQTTGRGVFAANDVATQPEPTPEDTATTETTPGLPLPMVGAAVVGLALVARRRA